MAMKIFQRRLSNGPTSLRFALSILCMAGLSSFAAGPVAAAAEDESFFTHLHTEKAMANVTVSPGRAGPVEITIQLETTDELPLTARAVSVTLSDVQSGIGPQTIQAVRAGDDQWHVRTSMPSSGRWMLGLGISISDTDKINIESPIVIR
jgi:hypothetical protein